MNTLKVESVAPSPDIGRCNVCKSAPTRNCDRFGVLIFDEWIFATANEKKGENNGR